MNKSKEYSISRITAWLILDQLIISAKRLEEIKLDEAGLTIPQFFIIAALNYLKPPVTPTDLSKCLDRNSNTITLTLDRMEKAGLIKKKRDLPDRRMLRVTLTPKSKRLFSEAIIRFINVPEDTMSFLSDEELKDFTGLAKKLIKGLFEKLGISELSSHRVDTTNYVLSTLCPPEVKPKLVNNNIFEEFQPRTDSDINPRIK